MMKTRALGKFDVKLTPQSQDKDPAGGATLGRISIEKQFHGDLEATSRGEMLSAMTNVPGSAGYVAIERVTGKLHGRAGSFVLQHFGTMERDAEHLSITIVPDSGTGELTGVSGQMTIHRSGGEHSYDFEYSVPAES
jgi:hypothetical protein